MYGILVWNFLIGYKQATKKLQEMKTHEAYIGDRKWKEDIKRHEAYL